MKHTGVVCLSTLWIALVSSGCALHGQSADPASPFRGEWILDKSFGVTPPQAWSMKVDAAANRVMIRSHWDEPKDGRFGLTLLGLTTAEFAIDPRGDNQAAQVGPFVLHYRSAWENGKLVTRWSTSEYMGSSFQGTWTRAVSKDGATQTIDVDATSSDGQTSRARLIFRRRV